MTLLAENVNLLLVLAGFACLELGIARQWSGAVASIVGGGLLMLLGGWPYLARPFRKRT